jgi:hypothetical protein
MSGVPSGMRRVNARFPCPICEKRDWCLLAEDGSRAICARMESDRRAGDAGWLHVLHASWPPPRRRRGVTIELSNSNFEAYAAQAEHFDHDDGPRGCEELASKLGVSKESLTRLRVGWNGWAWTFPMCDARGATIGIRLRRPDGAKLAAKGSRQGVFVPSAVDASGRLLVVEGPSDTAAALDLGFAAIGRPSCNGGADLIRSFVTHARCTDVVVFADGDGPGRKGAATLAKQLAPFTRVRVTEPPNAHKDLREWLRAGARTADVERVIEAAQQVHLTLRVRS